MQFMIVSRKDMTTAGSVNGMLSRGQGFSLYRDKT